MNIEYYFICEKKFEQNKPKISIVSKVKKIIRILITYTHLQNSDEPGTLWTLLRSSSRLGVASSSLRDFIVLLLNIEVFQIKFS